MEDLTQNLTLETLPKAFTQLTNEVGEIKRLLLEKHYNRLGENSYCFGIKELCIYHPNKPDKSTVHDWINAGVIPVYRKGKKLLFLKSEIDNWLKRLETNKCNTNSGYKKRIKKLEKSGRLLKSFCY